MSDEKKSRKELAPSFFPRRTRLGPPCQLSCVVMQLAHGYCRVKHNYVQTHATANVDRSVPGRPVLRDTFSPGPSGRPQRTPL